MIGFSGDDIWKQTDPNDGPLPCDDCEYTETCKYTANIDECPKFEDDYGAPEYDPCEDMDREDRWRD
jgi:hypothetical protein